MSRFQFNKEKWASMHNEPVSDETSLLDEDETLDFLLYQEMEKETKSRPPKGCMGGLIFFFLFSVSVMLLANFL